MALNPNIALGYQPPPIQTPDLAGNMVRGMQLKQLAQSMDLNNARAEQERLQTDEIRRKQQEALKVREILMNEPDPAKALPKVYAISPEAANALSDHLNKRQKEARDAEFQQLTSNAKKLELMGSIAGSMKDQSTYDAGIGRAVNAGILTGEQVDKLPKEWDQAKPLVEQFAQQALSAQQQHDLAIKQAQAKRAAEESAAKLPGTKAESYTKRLELAAQLMGSASTPEQWVSRFNGLDPDLRGHFGTDFTPENVNAATQLGLSAKELTAASQRQSEQADTKEYRKEVVRTRDEANRIRSEGNGVQDRFNKWQEQKAHDNAIKERDKYARQVDAGEREIASFEKRKAVLKGDIAKYEQVLKDNPEGMLGANKARKDAIQKLADLKAEHGSIVKQQGEIKDRMDKAQSEKDAIKVGGGGSSANSGGAIGGQYQLGAKLRNPKTGEVVELTEDGWKPAQ